MTPAAKTLAMRVLDGRRIHYQVIEFPDTIHDALGVAEYAGIPAESVYKTLVAQVVDPSSGAPIKSHKTLLVLVPATRSLDPKKVAAALGVRKVAMARQADAERLTGLKVGGISALALLQRGFAVYLDEEAIVLDEIVVSAGQRGLNLRLKVHDLIEITGAKWLGASRLAAGAIPDQPSP